MGGKRNKVSEAEEEPEWPYSVSIDLRKSPKPKVAFWSCKEREYYPEDLGHSRLAVTERSKNDAPNPSYMPPPFGLNKPVSLFGYGIGGLLSLRFPRNQKEELPDPGQYQKIFDRDPDTPLTEPEMVLQCKNGFGTSNAISRFGRTPKFQPPGPGSYEVSCTSKCPSIARFEAFGGKRKIQPSVITVCMVDGGERCCECGDEQMADYYRSKKKLNHPEKKRPSILVLCRSCYCKAWNGGFPHWPQKGLSEMFQKARHCDFLHEHQRLHQFMHKTSCHDVRRLTRREAVLNKYYKDCCPPNWTRSAAVKI